jgi:hypothetical protein
MGNYLWNQKSSKVTHIDIKHNSKKILINQAFCSGCNKIVRDDGRCSCSNVEIKNGIHTFTNKELYSNCSLIEYK